MPKRVCKFKNRIYRITQNAYSPLPVTKPETVKSVITPRVTLAGTQSISIQNETQEMATIKIDGK